MFYQSLERKEKISGGKVNGKSKGLLFVCVKSRLLSRTLPLLLEITIGLTVALILLLPILIRLGVK